MGFSYATVAVLASGLTIAVGIRCHCNSLIGSYLDNELEKYVDGITPGLFCTEKTCELSDEMVKRDKADQQFVPVCAEAYSNLVRGGYCMVFNETTGCETREVAGFHVKFCTCKHEDFCNDMKTIKEYADGKEILPGTWISGGGSRYPLSVWLTAATAFAWFISLSAAA